MSGSLYSALSGLQAHQNWIDVIGNNLANTNTPGYKSSYATFSDQFSRTLRYASLPGSGLGGRNPVQIGLGVRLGDIGRNFSQGALTSTGRTFDVAMQGRGFFAVNNGTQNLYTRVGTFGLDAVGNLVDQRTGFRVLNASGQSIAVDTNALLAPKATSAMRLTGNLPATISGPLPEVLTGAGGLRHGTSATLTGTNAGPYTVPVGETWTMQVVANGGSVQTVSVTSTTGTITAAEIAAEIDALSGVSASVDVNGNVEVLSDRKGTNASVKINPGASGRDLAQLTGLSTVLVRGTERPFDAATTLNDLPGNRAAYQDGDLIHVSGVDVDGTAINASFTYGAANDGTTVQEFLNFLESSFPGATVSTNSNGQLVVTANTPGETNLMLTISDDASAAGQTQWSLYALSVTTQGTAADEVSTSMEVFDPAGVAHALTFTLQRQADGTWTLTPSLPASQGQVLSSPITGITFDNAGTPAGFSGTGVDVTVQFAGQSVAQSMQVDIGSDGQLNGLTQLGAEGEIYGRDGDGYGVGQLATLSVGGTGDILGFYTNGQMQSLGALGVATFSNPEGLLQVSDGMFSASANSGTPNLGAGGTSGAGTVVGGALENSNVDTAEQFVRLIEAQRGFQANARVITAQDEVLRETVNLI